MSFALTKQKGPATAWDYFRPKRNKRRKRSSTLSNKSPNKNKINGILFPETIMPILKIHIANVININLK